MFDSDQPDVLLNPLFDGCRVATYADLLNPTLVKQFGPRLVVIERGLGDPLGLATVADIESGADSIDRGTSLVRQWISERRPGPTAYHDRADWPAVNAALAGTPARHWVATLDGTCSPGGTRPAAVQILNANDLGVHADVSIVWDETWHPVTGPAALPEVEKLRQIAAQANPPFRALIALIESL